MHCPFQSPLQVNEGLADVPTDNSKFDYSLRQDVTQVQPRMVDCPMRSVGPCAVAVLATSCSPPLLPQVVTVGKRVASGERRGRVRRGRVCGGKHLGASLRWFWKPWFKTVSAPRSPASLCCAAMVKYFEHAGKVSGELGLAAP